MTGLLPLIGLPVAAAFASRQTSARNKDDCEVRVSDDLEEEAARVKEALEILSFSGIDKKIAALPRGAGKATNTALTSDGNMSLPNSGCGLTTCQMRPIASAQVPTKLRTSPPGNSNRYVRASIYDPLEWASCPS